MFARSNTIQTKAESIDQGIEFIRAEVVPATQGMEGCSGLSLTVDRETGRCIVTTSWESESAMRESESAVTPLRERAAEIMAAPVMVQHWEVAAVHRVSYAPEGACARLTWMQADPADLGHAVDVFKFGALPAIEALDGFCSASLMVDRASGAAVSTVTFDGRANLEASRGNADAIRSKATKEARAEVLRVDECELVHAHLHVPELV